MDKLKMQTKNLADENYKKLAAMFPNAITEKINENGELVRAIDVDVLKQEMSVDVVEGKEERYQFTWPDKKKAIAMSNLSVSGTLRPCINDSIDFDTTKNVYIEGDNLDVLKLLQETYLGKIKTIYIDPPYNTGNDFIYEDDFALSASEYLANSGQLDELGNRLFQNSESNGRFHTDWLNMIYPRLKLSKNLLTDDGVIFISIDENELENLKKICDEIFGESNFVCQLVWAAGRKNDSKYISISHEYILCYVKSIEYLQENRIIWREKKQGLEDIYSKYEILKKSYGEDYEKIEKELKNWFKSLPDGHPAKDHSHYSRVDKEGIYFADNISWPGGGGPKYDLLHPVTGKPVKIPSRGWLTNETTMKEWISQGKVDFGKDENCVPTLKSYLRDREYSVPYSVFYKDGRASSKRLATLMGDKVFENPKDEEIISRIIEFCGTDDDDIVLDFFSGSGTTAHGVFLCNHKDGKKRHFILVQLPEIIDSSKASSTKSKKVAQNAEKLLDSINRPHNICEIGKERIRRAANDINDMNIDTGFRVFKLDSSNMKDVYYSPSDTQQTILDSFSDNIKPGRTSLDLLFQVMLDLGVKLSSKIEKNDIDNKDIYSVEDGFLIACFDDGITDLIQERLVVT